MKDFAPNETLTMDGNSLTLHHMIIHFLYNYYSLMAVIPWNFFLNLTWEKQEIRSLRDEW